MAYPRYQLARAFKRVRKTDAGSGVYTVSSTSFANLDGSNLDIVLQAQVDDYVEVGASFLWVNQAVTGYFDFATIVGGSPVNHVSGVTGGVSCLWGNSSVYQPVGGAVLYKIVSGDLSGGLVTLRPRARVSSGSRQLYASTDNAFDWYAKNLGPADPN